MMANKKQRARVSVEMRAPVTVSTTGQSVLLLRIRLFRVLFDLLVLLVILPAVVTLAHGILLWIRWPA